MSTASRLPLRCWAEIDLAVLERNLRLIRASLPDHMRYVAVIKADAYGHGLPQTAARLMHAGADLFAVANLAEAAALREIGPGWPVLLLSPLLPEEDRHVLDYDVAVTISSEAEVTRLDNAARAAGRSLTVHLKIDTGMGRLGVWYEKAPALYLKIREATHLRLAGVFTHFSSSDDDAVFTAEQRRRFLNALQACPGIDLGALLIHADNSAGLETIEVAGPFNAVRVGLLQFGIMPHADSLLAQVQAEPVFSFHTRIALVKQLPAGTAVSYGRTCSLKRDSTVAILAAGYGDGVARAASNRGHVLIRGKRCPILGRVTMDQTIVDVTDVPGVETGDPVVLVGRQQDEQIGLTEFSRWADTIPWETLTSVTKRVPRLYRTSLGL
ncbi:MAG: alanine racemase [Opitutus sp.]|nr:alanine racemase [Opitutus sp.]MCS6246674.1 alanine racemase [Opitutus sp.]MCS6272835.1 alanine racemase [Opitutus sp.]MCS6278833.1 alanine racemase [Opitutus sp.]MCS6299589.1 alanine racemase [Opitutus sp.]